MKELWNECPETKRYNFLAFDMLMPVGDALLYSWASWDEIPAQLQGAIESWFA